MPSPRFYGSCSDNYAMLAATQSTSLIGRPGAAQTMRGGAANDRSWDGCHSGNTAAPSCGQTGPRPWHADSRHRLRTLAAFCARAGSMAETAGGEKLPAQVVLAVHPFGSSFLLLVARVGA
eukprot:356995-Chlamydomonas_euryale.AAC.12